MVQEERKHYRGVLCLHCRQPIPIPASVARKGEQSGNHRPGVPGDLGPRAFSLRCRACHGEALYAESKFVDCEGSPRVRNTSARKPTLVRQHTENLSRAANG